MDIRGDFIMNFSIDIVLICINLIALAFSYGKFSEKINQVEKKLATISDTLTLMNTQYYTLRDGNRLEIEIKAMWDKVDNCPCKTCLNFKHDHA